MVNSRHEFIVAQIVSSYRYPEESRKQSTQPVNTRVAILGIARHEGATAQSGEQQRIRTQILPD